MRFLIVLIRVLALLVGIVGYFTLVVIVGILFIMLARDMFKWSEYLESKYVSEW